MTTRPHDLTRRLEALRAHGWRVVDDHHLERSFSFPDWAAALAFVNRLSPLAEALKHHPDVELGWGRVVLKLRTHDTHAISALDAELAERIAEMDA